MWSAWREFCLVAPDRWILEGGNPVVTHAVGEPDHCLLSLGIEGSVTLAGAGGRAGGGRAAGGEEQRARGDHVDIQTEG